MGECTWSWSTRLVPGFKPLRICGHHLQGRKRIPSCSEPRSCFCKHSWTLASWESFSCNLRRSFSSSSWWASNSSLRFCLDTDPPQPMAKRQRDSPRHNHEIQKTWALQNVPKCFWWFCVILRTFKKIYKKLQIHILQTSPNLEESGSHFSCRPFFSPRLRADPRDAQRTAHSLF